MILTFSITEPGPPQPLFFPHTPRQLQSHGLIKFSLRIAGMSRGLSKCFSRNTHHPRRHSRELWLSRGYLDRSLEAAQQAGDVIPG
jgi:hypothetical protein